MVFIILSIIAFASSAICETGVNGGVGLTHLEQRFVLFEQDTIASSNEAKAYIEGIWRKRYGNDELDCYTIFSGGTQTFWGKLKGGHEWTGPANLKLKTDLAMDIRQPYTIEDIPGYYKTSADFRARKKWDDSRGSARISWENKRFTSESNYSYDYSLTRARFDFGFPLVAERDEFSLGYQFSFRYAPDTIQANYQRNNIFASWDYFVGGNYWRADFEAERRVYNRGDLSGNNWRTYWNIAPKIGLSERLSIEPKLIAESYRYDMASAVYPNRDEIAVISAVEWGFSAFLYAGLAPKYLVSWSNLSESDNYREYSLEMAFNWLKYRSFWIDLTIEPGFRVYKGDIPDEYAYYSNFGFVEFSAMSSWWINERLRLDFIAIYSPEWHDIDENDITTLYFSTNLKYELFKSK